HRYLRSGSLASPASHSTEDARCGHSFALAIRLSPSTRERVLGHYFSGCISPVVGKPVSPNGTSLEEGASAVEQERQQLVSLLWGSGAWASVLRAFSLSRSCLTGLQSRHWPARTSILRPSPLRTLRLPRHCRHG